MEIPRTELTVLFNALSDIGERTVPVTHPSDTIGQLFEIQLEREGQARIDFTLSTDEYRDRRSSINEQYGEPAVTELPRPNSFVHAFAAAGVVPLPNRGDLDEFLDRHGHPDLTAGHRPVVAGFDTNLLPWHIADVLSLEPGHDAAVNGFALATGVRDELVWDRKRKDTQSLEAAFGSKFDALWNQPRGPDREGRLGENYYRQLRDRRYAEEISTGTGDDEIVDGYDGFQHSAGKDVLLFSNDRDFIERARSQRILAHWVDLPRTLPETAIVPWRQAQNVLYHLTVLFGVLEIPKTTLYGVWTGKGGTEWQRDLLTVDCRSPKVTPILERDLAMVAAYNDRT